MAKKKFTSPFVLLIEDQGDVTVIGKGSGQSSPDADDVAWSYEDWAIMDGSDYYTVDSDPAGSINDYIVWWYDQMGGDAELFELVNGYGLPADPRNG